jgi:iron complex transport system substrate-binding protein
MAGGLAVVTAAAVAWASTDGPPQKPKRVVSLNMCSDQLVLVLADRDQIAGLTHNAGNRVMSAEAARTKGLRILSGSAEEIIDIDPDLVVGMPARRNAALGVLKGQNYRALDVRSAESYTDIVASIRQVAAALGHPARGEAVIARMDRDLAALPKAPRGSVAAYYQRRGFMTGAGTLVDDLMTRVGLVNLATRLGKPSLSQLSLEEMAAAHPDYLIVESASDRVVDQGTEMLHHPAIKDIPRLRIPQAWTVCGGPAYVLAAQSLARQISAR